MMAESTFLVVQPGVLTTIQDLGRFGYGSIGMPAAGAMDPYAHQLANLMVGDSLHEATLEMTFIGPTLVSKGSHRFATRMSHPMRPHHEWTVDSSLVTGPVVAKPRSGTRISPFISSLIEAKL